MVYPVLTWTQIILVTFTGIRYREILLYVHLILILKGLYLWIENMELGKYKREIPLTD